MLCRMGALLALMTGLLVSGPLHAAPAWTPYAKVAQFQMLITGQVLVLLDGYTDVGQGCPSAGDWLILTADNSSEVDGVARGHVVLTQAFFANRKVKLLLNGCTFFPGAAKAPKITSVEVSIKN